MLKNSARYVRKRSFKDFNGKNFTAEVKNVHWWPVYNCQDPDEAAQILTDKLTEILDRHAPVKMYQTKTNFAPWLSTGTKKLMSERDKAQLWASTTGNRNDWGKYRYLRNKVTKNLKTEKKSWQKKKLEECNKDSAKLWANVKGWLNWSSSSSPSKLFAEGRIETSPLKIATIMNNFYIDKVQKIREDLAHVGTDPLAELRKQMRSLDKSFTLKPIHPDLVRKIISELRNSKATGFDNIDTHILKLICDVVTPSITHIINLSIRSSKFPRIWKHSKVIPLLKPGAADQLSAKSYRPVALLPVVSKVLERVVFLQIVEYMESNQLFHPNHHGFRSLHSTTTAMLQLYDSWVEAIEKGEMSAVVMIDQSAAFDCVDHRILRDKLALYGFDPDALIWIESYLSEREQSCHVEGFTSSPLSVSVGVPQGSILGPLLYCIFTNDFPEVVQDEDCNRGDTENLPGYSSHCQKCGGVTIYADDSTYTVSDKDQEKLSEKISAKFKSMADYLTS